MALEIEAKVPVKKFDPIIETLKKVGAVNNGKVFMQDYYFDSAGVLLGNDSCLRLRIESEYPSKKFSQSVLCYKGPKLAGKFKSREEIETSISNAENAAVILDRLGWKKTLIVEKVRENWCLEDTLVCLDTLDAIGLFVEIEGPNEESVSRVKETLGLADIECEKRSYAELLTLKLKPHSP